MCSRKAHVFREKCCRNTAGDISRIIRSWYNINSNNNNVAIAEIPNYCLLCAWHPEKPFIHDLT